MNETRLTWSGCACSSETIDERERLFARHRDRGVSPSVPRVCALATWTGSTYSRSASTSPAIANLDERRGVERPTRDRDVIASWASRNSTSLACVAAGGIRRARAKCSRPHDRKVFRELIRISYASNSNQLQIEPNSIEQRIARSTTGGATARGDTRHFEHRVEHGEGLKVAAHDRPAEAIASARAARRRGGPGRESGDHGTRARASRGRAFTWCAGRTRRRVHTKGARAARDGWFTRIVRETHARCRRTRDWLDIDHAALGGSSSAPSSRPTARRAGSTGRASCAGLTSDAC